MSDRTRRPYRDKALHCIETECAAAQAKRARFNSGHEGYAVVLEELDEAWQEIKRDDLHAAVREMIQLGAMAVRFVAEIWEQLDNESEAE